MSKKRAARSSRPQCMSFGLVAGAFGGGLRLGHSLRHLCLEGIKIETCAPLHRRVIEESLQCLADYLLDEDKAPEFVLKPRHVILRAFFRLIVGPARALERIKPQVDEDWHVRMVLDTQPATGLVDESILVVVDANRAERAFAEIEDFVTHRRPFAGDGGHLV